MSDAPLRYWVEATRRLAGDLAMSDNPETTADVIGHALREAFRAGLKAHATLIGTGETA